MTPSAIQFSVGVGMLVVNLIWMGTQSTKLTARYLQRQIPASTGVWATALLGAAVLYLGTLSSSRRPGGWGLTVAAGPAPGTATAIGVVLVTLGWLMVLIDSQTMRLPNLLTAVMAAEVIFVVLVLPMAIPVGKDWYLACAAGAALWFLPLSIGMRFRQVGVGDVKLAPVLGCALATCSFRVAGLGLALAFVSVGINALVVKNGKAPVRRVSFGPHLLGASGLAWTLATLGPSMPITS